MFYFRVVFGFILFVFLTFSFYLFKKKLIFSPFLFLLDFTLFYKYFFYTNQFQIFWASVWWMNMIVTIMAFTAIIGRVERARMPMCRVKSAVKCIRRAASCCGTWIMSVMWKRKCSVRYALSASAANGIWSNTSKRCIISIVMRRNGGVWFRSRYVIHNECFQSFLSFDQRDF